MEKADNFIYSNRFDAYSYLVVFLLSIVIPSIVSFVFKETKILLLSMFINSLEILRDYVPLMTKKPVSPVLWIKRGSGVFLAIFIAIYCVASLFLLENNIGENFFQKTTLVATCVLLYYGIISGVEGILYSIKSYKQNKDDYEHPNEIPSIVTGNTSDV